MQVIKFGETKTDPKAHARTLAEFQWLATHAQEHQDYMLLILEDQMQIVFYNAATQQAFKERNNG
jgi:hypothetical protein